VEKKSEKQNFLSGVSCMDPHRFASPASGSRVAPDKNVGCFTLSFKRV